MFHYGKETILAKHNLSLSSKSYLINNFKCMIYSKQVAAPGLPSNGADFILSFVLSFWLTQRIKISRCRGELSWFSPHKMGASKSQSLISDLRVSFILGVTTPPWCSMRIKCWTRELPLALILWLLLGWGGFSTQIETSYFQFWRLRGGKGSRKHRVRKSSIVLCDLWAGFRMFSEAQ